MIPVNFPGAQEIKKPASMTDEECSSIYAQPLVNEMGVQCWLTAWQPSYEDMKAFSEGRPVFIKILAPHIVTRMPAGCGPLLRSTGLPPMALFTFDEEGKIN